MDHSFTFNDDTTIFNFSIDEKDIQITDDVSNFDFNQNDLIFNFETTEPESFIITEPESIQLEFDEVIVLNTITNIGGVDQETITLLDWISDEQVIKGVAVVGSETDESVWNIYLIEIDFNNPSSILYANNDQLSNKIWDDRHTYIF